jgi:glycosyltransferase involved in cell wall biosynthesis
MKIAAYVQLNRSVSMPTGVGKHLIHMVRGLWMTPGMDVNILAPRNQLDQTRQVPADNPLAGIPASGLPFDRRWLEAMWEILNAPKVDHWCGKVDWIYSPTEAFIAARRPRLAVTVHDLHAFEPDLPWSHTSEHRAFRRRWARMMVPIVRHADCILAVSEFTRRRLTELLHVNPDRIAVVGNGVESAYFDSSPSSGTDERPEQEYIMVVGGLTRRKGGDLVLRLAQALMHERPNMRVLVAGRGEAEFTGPAAALSNVTLLGYAPTQELAQCLRGATAMLMLSRYEGFGIPVLEAMAAGAPVISSRSGALPEVVGDAGLLVDQENVVEVLEAIELLATNGPARQKLRRLGKARARDYRWNRCVERLVRALREH